MKKVELYWLSSFIRAAPCKGVCGWEAPCLFMPDSPNRVQGLNDLFFRGFDQQGRISVEAVSCFSWSRNTQGYLLTRLCRVDQAF